jgi:hypothetical protein
MRRAADPLFDGCAKARSDVRFGSKADIRTAKSTCPLYPRKRFDVGIIDNLAAHKSGVVMPNEELGRALEMPVSCPHCPKYSMQPVAFVVTSEKFTCPDCKATIDLTTKEWVAFRQKFQDALKELQPLYKQLP